MQLSFSALALAALPILASAAPMTMRESAAKGKVDMVFEIGGRSQVMSSQVTGNTCMSIASGGVLVAMRTSKDVVCRMRSGGCESSSPVSPPMSGTVNLNGSGELAQFAQFARSVECGLKNEDPNATVMTMKFSVDGQTEQTASMDVEDPGCLSLPRSLSISSMTVGSKAACELATSCSGGKTVMTLKGKVNVKKASQAIAQGASALKCSRA
ncbi:hypothetical protein DL96DRAFT_1605786 [Flagelloscypha sp. PMI_526]|nr:hypothetical protein DL96DRAFT_1605786 [Flagelloscypha sp. PMI_526]